MSRAQLSAQSEHVPKLGETICYKGPGLNKRQAPLKRLVKSWH